MARARGPWGWALGGALAGLLCATLAFAPARWLQQALDSVSHGRVLLTDLQGDVWNGSAQLSLTGGADSYDQQRLPGRVHWDIRPGWGALSLALQADCCTTQAQQLVLRPLWGGWALEVAPGTSAWPAALLGGLGTPWNTLALQGRMEISTPGLRLSSALQRWNVEGSLTLRLQQASSRLSTLKPLGSYQLELLGGAAPRLTLSTLEGSLQLRGNGQWTAARLHFEGEARADPARSGELDNLLNIIGRRDGSRSVITLG